MPDDLDRVRQAMLDAARRAALDRTGDVEQRILNDDARRAVRDARGHAVELHVEETGTFWMLGGQRVRIGDVLEVETELGWLPARVEQAGDAHARPMVAVRVRGGPRVAFSLADGVRARRSEDFR